MSSGAVRLTSILAQQRRGRWSLDHEQTTWVRLAIDKPCASDARRELFYACPLREGKALCGAKDGLARGAVTLAQRSRTGEATTFRPA